MSSPVEIALASLERHALDGCGADLAGRERRIQAFTCYLALREKICVELLPLISSRQPFINDHTRTHLLRVLKHIENLLARHFPRAEDGPDIPESREVCWADSMIVLNALVWHDLGNIRGRLGHAKQVHDLFETIAPRLYEDRLAELVKQVAEAHSGTGAIERIIPNSFAAQAFHGEDIHPQFLAALLRFADELDEDSHRIATSDYATMDLVPADAQRFWFFNNVNTSIRVVSHASDFGTNAPWVEIHSRIPQSRFDEGIPNGANATTPAMTEYLRRVLKIEAERRYCNPYLRKAYHHAGVAGIRVSINAHEGPGDRSQDSVINFELSDTLSIDNILQVRSLSSLHPHLSAARHL